MPSKRGHVQCLVDANTCAGYSDILSYYKEDIEEDTSSYMHARARVSGKSMDETLLEVVDEVAAATKRIRAHLGQGRARDAWERFETHYIWFHIACPRYRLQEILGERYHALTEDHA